MSDGVWLTNANLTPAHDWKCPREAVGTWVPAGWMPREDQSDPAPDLPDGQAPEAAGDVSDGLAVDDAGDDSPTAPVEPEITTTSKKKGS